MSKSKINLKQIAEETLILSSLVVGREKLSTDEVIDRYPKGFTVVQVDKVRLIDKKSGEIDDFVVALIKEDEEVFIFGGTILTNIVDEWVEACGDLDQVNTELTLTKGVKMKFYHGKTKSGDNLTKITIL